MDNPYLKPFKRIKELEAEDKLKQEHLFTLEYTTDDDGIVLVCSCGAYYCMGFWPSVDKAVELSKVHIANMRR